MPAFGCCSASHHGKPQKDRSQSIASSRASLLQLVPREHPLKISDTGRAKRKMRIFISSTCSVRSIFPSQGTQSPKAQNQGEDFAHTKKLWKRKNFLLGLLCRFSLRSFHFSKLAEKYSPSASSKPPAAAQSSDSSTTRPRARC